MVDATVCLDGLHCSFSRNEVGRDFVIGDIHGDLVGLDLTLSMLDFDIRTDRLFCTGDLVDRGRNSYSVLSLVLLQLRPWFFSTLGNHEVMTYTSIAKNINYFISRMFGSSGDLVYVNTAEDYEGLLQDDGIKFLFDMGILPSFDEFIELKNRVLETNFYEPENGAELSHHLMNGGRWLFDLSLSQLGNVMKCISSMPLLIDVVGSDGDLVGIVHTDPPNDWGIAVSYAKGLSINDLVEHKSPEANSMIWGRRVASLFNLDEPVSPVSGVDRVYIGHTVMPEVSTPAGSNIHLIDTGCWRANMDLWWIGKNKGLAYIDEVTTYNEIIL